MTHTTLDEGATESAAVTENAPPVTSVVVVQDLVVKYGERVAVNGLNLSVNPGEIVGLLGDNGAGKSSTMRVLATLNPPTSGFVTVAGHRLDDTRAAERARAVTGYCPDVGGLIRSATTREHIGVALRLHKKENLWGHALALVEKFGLTAALDQPTSGFSHGMSRRLSVILAALSSDRLLILDEPFDGVDPVGVDATINLINEARAAGLAVILSTHLQELLVRAADRVVVVVGGRNVDGGLAADFSGAKGEQRYRALLAAKEVAS